MGEQVKEVTQPWQNIQWYVSSACDEAIKNLSNQMTPHHLTAEMPCYKYTLIIMLCKLQVLLYKTLSTLLPENCIHFKSHFLLSFQYKKTQHFILKVLNHQTTGIGRKKQTNKKNKPDRSVKNQPKHEAQEIFQCCLDLFI